MTVSGTPESLILGHTKGHQNDSQEETNSRPESPSRLFGEFKAEAVQMLPIAFLKAKVGASNISAIDIPNLLIHTDAPTRRAAVNFRLKIAEKGNLAISEYSFSVLSENKEHIANDDAARWYMPAVTTLGVLEDDFLLNLSGFRQCIGVDQLGEMQNIYWHRVIYPKSPPGKYVPADLFAVAADESRLQNVIKTCRGTGTPSEVVSNYLKSLGHLPLIPPYSLSSVLTDFRGTESPSELFRQLTEIADSGPILHQYHACQALCDFWDSWSAEQRQHIRQAVEAFVSMSTTSDASTTRGREWLCRLQLVQHYLRWGELHGPGWNADALTALSWWVADQLSTSINKDCEGKADPKECFETLQQRCFEPAMKLSEILSQLVRPEDSGSPFRVYSLRSGTGGPFAISLLAHLGCYTQERGGATPDELKATAIDAAMVRHLIFDDVAWCRTDAPVMGGIAVAWEKSVEAWLDNSPEEARSFKLARREKMALMMEPNSIYETIIGLPEQSPDERIETIATMLSLAQSSRLPTDPLWQLVNESDQLIELLGKLGSEEVDYLLNVFVCVQQASDVSWKRELPHALTKLLSRCRQNDDLRRSVLLSVVWSAVNINCYSEVRRLRAENRDRAISDYIDDLCDYIRRNRDDIPDWTWSRLRPVLACLR